MTIIEFDRIDSTNLEAKRLASGGKDEWTVVMANSQNMGRGRLGRSFFSPEGSGLYMSVILRPKITPADAQLITVAAAVAVSRAIEKVFSRRAGIKWVNDLILDGKKICGILTESALDPKSGMLEYAVLGIGINLFAPKEKMPDELKDIVGFVCDSECTASKKQQLTEEILRIFKQYYDGLTERSYLEEYRDRSVLKNTPVTVIKGDKRRNALAHGIDESFRLEVEYADGTQESLSGGEVSIRL